MTPKETFEAAYSILVEHAGAREIWRRDFVSYFTIHPRQPYEWRFQGTLGFGGKFWLRQDGFAVTCYSEDLTPERDLVIRRVNEALEPLFNQGLHT